MQQALDLAKSLSHPFTLGWVLGCAGDVYWKRGEELASQECWKEQASISAEQGFKLFLQSASFSLEFVVGELAESGEKGIERMRDVYNHYTRQDDTLFPDKARWLSLLALSHGKAGQVDEALVRITEALTIAEKRKTPKDLCDLNVFKGQLLLMRNPNGLVKARQCFSRAIGVVRSTRAKSEELTAVIQMAQLLRDIGRRDEARTMLAKI
jgi:tetratricopeptide (TPR) repeat protein